MVKDTVGNVLCNFLSNVGLLLDIDVLEWIVVKG
jgi:hypothetical protein